MATYSFLLEYLPPYKMLSWTTAKANHFFTAAREAMLMCQWNQEALRSTLTSLKKKSDMFLKMQFQVNQD